MLDVAQAFAKALQKPVKGMETPRDQWIGTMQNMGFSNKTAVFFSKITTLAIKRKCQSAIALHEE
ncbi:hypothetical protein [Pleurocapsa sp. PCC 7327]|uniref:hypothetical protein n=1 Tax=Pleurocapsa sp. PCC 7327 TaxID=118163 RepID=UPI00031ACF69|nr:hypothetical protein [Pleurocapsa sp. PCC 7327]